MHRSILLASVFVCLVGCAPASAQGMDGLFLEMTMRTGRIETNHYYFLPDGRYLNGVPEGGLTVAGYDLACARPVGTYAGSSVCGTYTIAGGSLVFTPRKGPAESRTFERLADGNINLDGHFAKHVGTFPKGQILDGMYARVNSAGPVSCGESYAFKPDGTFSTKWLVGASTTDGATGGPASGTYRLEGNVLALTVNGTTTRIVAYPYDLGNGDVRLNLNGEFFKR